MAQTQKTKTAPQPQVRHKSVPLTMGMRDALKRLARDTVACPAEAAALKAAYAKAAPMVRKIVEAKFPRRDMLVCKKYGVAGMTHEIKLSLTAGGVDQFEFERGTGPLTASYSGGKIYATDDAVTDAVTVWRQATTALKAATDKKLADYYALIGGATKLEQVIEIWPDAEKFRPVGTSLIVLSSEVVGRIKADVAARKAA